MPLNTIFSIIMYLYHIQYITHSRDITGTSFFLSDFYGVCHTGFLQKWFMDALGRNAFPFLHAPILPFDGSSQRKSLQGSKIMLRSILLETLCIPLSNNSFVKWTLMSFQEDIAPFACWSLPFCCSLLPSLVSINL